MDSNPRIAIAKELLKVAKELSAAFTPQSFTFGNITVETRMLKLGNMVHEGVFVCVSGDYNAIKGFIPWLKQNHFIWEKDIKTWVCFHTKCDFQNVKDAVMNFTGQQPSSSSSGSSSAPDPNAQKAAQAPFSVGQEFSLDLVFTRASKSFKGTLNPSGIEYDKRFVNFKDPIENEFKACITDMASNHPESVKAADGCSFLWRSDGQGFSDESSWRSNVDNIVHVVGKIKAVKFLPARGPNSPEHYEFEFFMQ